MYSRIHWFLFSQGSRGDRFASSIVRDKEGHPVSIFKPDNSVPKSISKRRNEG